MTTETKGSALNHPSFPVYTEDNLPQEGQFSLSFRIKDGSTFQSLYLQYKGQRVGVVELYRPSPRSDVPYFTVNFDTNVDPAIGLRNIANSYIGFKNRFALPEYDEEELEEDYEKISDHATIEPVSILVSQVDRNEGDFPQHYGVFLEEGKDPNQELLSALTTEFDSFYWIRINTLFGDYFLDGDQPDDIPPGGKRDFGFVSTHKDISELIRLYKENAKIQFETPEDYEALKKLYETLFAPIPQYETLVK